MAIIPGVCLALLQFSFGCGMHWEYTSLCWGGSLRLLILEYVWLSCRAVILATKQNKWGGSLQLVASSLIFGKLNFHTYLLVYIMICIDSLSSRFCRYFDACKSEPTWLDNYFSTNQIFTWRPVACVFVCVWGGGTWLILWVDDHNLPILLAAYCLLVRLPSRLKHC